MCRVNLQGLILVLVLLLSSLVLFHSHHHLSHRTRLLSHYYRWSVFQSLRQLDLADDWFKLTLEPETECSHVFFWKAADITDAFFLLSELLRDFIERGLNVYEFLVLIASTLLEHELIDVVCGEQDRYLCALERVHERRGLGSIESIRHKEVNVSLRRLHLSDIVIETDQL